MVFIIGPVLVTFLATALHPALGVGVSAVIGLIGAVALAAQRSSQPPIRPTQQRPCRTESVAVACPGPGGHRLGPSAWCFGGMEVVVVAFAKEAGVLPYAGVILMAWAFGSLVAGAVTGAISWQASPARRFRVGATLLALSLLPLPFVSHPVGLALLLTLSGMAIAPTLIASVAVTQSSVDQTSADRGACVELDWYGRWRRRRRSCRWLADRPARGAQAGFVGVAIAGLLLTLSALFVRGPRPGVEPDPNGSRPSGLTDTPAAESSRPPVGTRN